MASDIDGGNVTEVFDGETMDGSAVDIVVTDEFIYWTDNSVDSGVGGIWRAERSGANAGLFIENQGDFDDPQFLAIDDSNGKLYFSDWSNGIFEAELSDGSGVTHVGNPGTNNTGIALRGDGEMLSVTAGSDDTDLYSTNLDTGETASLATLDGNHQQYGLAYDEENDVAYIGNFGDGTLTSYDFDTGEAELIREGFVDLLGIALSPSGTHLLLVERGGGVGAYQIDNGETGSLVPGDAHFGVAVAADPADIELSADGILFQDRFAGGAPSGWTFDFTPGSGTVDFIEDAEDSFGYGTDAFMMRGFEVQDLSNAAFFPDSEEVVTLSFDFIRRPTENDARWVRFDIRVGEQRAHVLSLITSNGRIHGPDPQPRFSDAPNTPVRLDTILNNSDEPIEYTGADGESTYTLASGQASVWVDGEQLLDEYNNARLASTGESLSSIRLLADDRTVATFDLANFTVFEGARVGAPIGPPAPSGFDDWREEHFTQEELDDDSISGPGADPAGDGIANIVKYALGLDPKSPSRELLPREEVREVDGDEYLTLVMTRPADVDDVEYNIQASADLAEWPDEAVLVEELTVDNDDGTITETYRDVQPIDDSDRRFLRLRVGLTD